MPIVGQFGSLAGLGSLILPGGAMESIGTITVGSGGAASIEFTSIPGTFQHLQVRLIGRGSSTSNTGGNYFNIRFNSNSATNYAHHQLRGDGGTADASANTSQTQMYGQRITNGFMSASIFGASIFDILDYTSTSKNKTLRNFGGWDANGSGQVFLTSGLWFATPAAITTITLTPETGNFAQHSTAALYGIKAP